MTELAQEMASKLIIDGTKVGWWRERVEAWARGERIAPITMDVAWTRRCNAACDFCAAKTQASASPSLDIPKEKAWEFLEDAAEIVSTLQPHALVQHIEEISQGGLAPLVGGDDLHGSARHPRDLEVG